MQWWRERKRERGSYGPSTFLNFSTKLIQTHPEIPTKKNNNNNKRRDFASPKRKTILSTFYYHLIINPTSQTL